MWVVGGCVREQVQLQAAAAKALERRVSRVTALNGAPPTLQISACGLLRNAEPWAGGAAVDMRGKSWNSSFPVAPPRGSISGLERTRDVPAPLLPRAYHATGAGGPAGGLFLPRRCCGQCCAGLSVTPCAAARSPRAAALHAASCVPRAPARLPASRGDKATRSLRAERAVPRAGSLSGALPLGAVVGTVCVVRTR